MLLMAVTCHPPSISCIERSIAAEGASLAVGQVVDDGEDRSAAGCSRGATLAARIGQVDARVVAVGYRDGRRRCRLARDQVKEFSR
jgi:hypothetical protein